MGGSANGFDKVLPRTLYIDIRYIFIWYNIVLLGDDSLTASITADSILRIVLINILQLYNIYYNTDVISSQNVKIITRKIMF